MTQEEFFNQTNVKARTFGGGRDPIYGRKGLLGSYRRYFSDFPNEGLDVASEIANTGIYKIIRPDNFNRVWNYYWSRTELRLRVMAQEIKMALIPNYSPERINFAQGFVENFLIYLQGTTSRGIKVEKDFYDFSTCQDLPAVRKILENDFGELHQEMEIFCYSPEQSK